MDDITNSQTSNLQANDTMPKEIDETDLLNTKINELENQYQEIENKYKRSIAERMNLERLYDSQKAFMTSKILEQLIDINDDLGVVLSQIPENEKESIGHMGTSMAHGKLTIMLMTNSVSEIAANIGDEFNPSLHEALSVEENEEMKNRITQVVRKGYILNDRVLRPARVIVGK